VTDTSRAAYTFLPYLRRGMSAEIDEPDTLAESLPGRAEFQVSLTVDGLSSEPGTRAVLHGPGDITGIDPALIGPTQPARDAEGFEPNYFPAVEFRSPEFPWMFTPASANTGGQLRPWLCLVAIERPDEVPPQDAALWPLNPDPTLPLPQVHIEDAAEELPDPADTFAWAHVQVAGTIPAGGSVADLIAQSPGAVTSRLLCARRLREDTSYIACVVPVFLAGRQAGLGQEVTADDLTYAWQTTETDFWLPVFHHWEFSTGAAGDFESLVRALEARPLPPEVGTRPLDVSDPGDGMPAASATDPRVKLGLEGALRVPGAPPTPWPQGGTTRASFQASLRALLDAPAKRNATDPTVPLAPPLYGRWYARSETVPRDRGKFSLPHWFRELNLDPRNRVAAALGTGVIQERQEELMERAWRQVGEIERANQALRQAQMARSAGGSMYADLSRLSPSALVQLTEPAHSRLRFGAVTARARVAETCLPDSALSPGFRRLLRPRGPVARRWRREVARTREGAQHPPLLERLAVGDLRVVSPRVVPAGTITTEVVSDALRVAGRESGASKLGFADITDAAMLGAPAQDFRPLADEEPERPQVRAAADSAEAAAFRAAASQHQANILQPAVAIGGCDSVPLSDLAGELLGELDPANTVPARIGARLRVPQGVWEQDDPLEPIMAAPKFPEPMFEPLRDLSQQWLLPGLEHVPANSISVVEPNPRFIESYMVGLNHEFGRELLWREYPTDQRGTYFRQFWDLTGIVPAPTTDAGREHLQDIEEIQTWNRGKHLGDARERGHSRDARLVLLVRGDLLKRYPKALIYAVAALKGAGGKRKPSTAAKSERYPIFRGTLEPDVTFLAFDLSAAEARGDSTRPGWFFVLQQEMTEPRFGLDDHGEWQSQQPSGWEDLSWGHLVAQADFDGLSHAPVTGSRPESWSFAASPGVQWGGSSTSSEIAYVALQRPVRVAIHADDLLPSP
jgi:hypothetical protein